MSRYKKASRNEYELKEIDGIKPILRPTKDERMDIVELFMDQQTEKKLDVRKANKLIADLLYNSIFIWENNKRTDKKEAGSEDVTAEDVESFVIDNLFMIWLDILDALKIIDKKALEELQKKQNEDLEKAKDEQSPN
jgi:ATP-dependent helicase YprA (DUF1998 family)